MAKTLFNHLDAIYTNQALEYYDSLDDADKKSYNNYMINRLISMNVSFLEIANEFQKLLGVISGRESYLFYSQALPKGKRYAKYIKGSTDKYEAWLMDVVIRYFEVGKDEAQYYIDILMLTEGGKDNLRKIATYFGIEPKLIKKVIA